MTTSPRSATRPPGWTHLLCNRRGPEAQGVRRPSTATRSSRVPLPGPRTTLRHEDDRHLPVYEARERAGACHARLGRAGHGHLPGSGLREITTEVARGGKSFLRYFSCSAAEVRQGCVVTAGTTDGGLYTRDVHPEDLSDSSDHLGRRIRTGAPVLQPHVRHDGQARSGHLVCG